MVDSSATRVDRIESWFRMHDGKRKGVRYLFRRSLVRSKSEGYLQQVKALSATAEDQRKKMEQQERRML